jgi:hypothetical protein
MRHRRAQRFGLITQNGAVKEPPKKTDPLSRTARSISDSTSDTPAWTGRAGVSANEGGVPVIVDMALDEDNHAQSSGWPGRFCSSVLISRCCVSADFWSSAGPWSLVARRSRAPNSPNGLEQLFRDVRGARFHPLPEHQQRRLAGRLALGLPIDG